MLKTYILADDAQDDMESIFRYIAFDNVRAAVQLTDKIHKACDNLAHMPMMGHVRNDITDKPLRF